jgi:uracil-DNA glycosylase family 4
MRSELEAIVEELKRLRDEGVEHVNVSKETVQLLKKSVSENKGGKADFNPASNTAIAAQIPDGIRSASPEEFNRLLKEDVAGKSNQSTSGDSKMGKAPTFTLPEGDKVKRWEALKEIVLNCPICQKNTRNGFKTVFGVGNLDADIFFCGEAPGGDEEEQGEPFVGKAGQLLNKMIKAMGLEREQVYIGNIMNWRPSLPTRVGNRPPTREEMDFCLPYLVGQIEIVKPKIIVALGATAAKGLLGYGSFRSLSEVKGVWHEFTNTPMIPTYHPSYLLRNDSKRDKRAAWEDLLKVMERCELPISDKQRGYFL